MDGGAGSNVREGGPGPGGTVEPGGGEDANIGIKRQILQSNPILKAFGDARTLCNDNSSRFGKYIDVRFTSKGGLSGARIDTYLLEKVRLVRPSPGERNYHVFYQFLEAATPEERSYLGLDGLGKENFGLLNCTGTWDRRDGVVDGEMHREMLDAMVSPYLFLHQRLQGGDRIGLLE